jgi:hypothetical protein
LQRASDVSWPAETEEWRYAQVAGESLQAGFAALSL